MLLFVDCGLVIGVLTCVCLVLLVGVGICVYL